MKIILTVLTVLLTLTSSFAQNQINYNSSNEGNFNPDSLKLITVSGKVIADSSIMNGMYFLDINNDNSADYALIFGPDWYIPDSSSAERPNVGDTITITGGLFTGMPSFIPMLVVYSIDGNFWRSPYDSYWNEMGYNSMMGGMNHEGMGYAFGWDHDSLQSINLGGNILIDSTFIYNHYYLDTNNDGRPEYMLNFGPPWYSSFSGAKLPLSGEKVSISGFELNNAYMNMIIVTGLNGYTWRDSTQFGNNLGGGWIQSGMGNSQFFSNPFDSTDWMEINPGWHGGGMMGGGGMMPDSLYCQILEVFPQNVPGDSGENAMAAFEVGIFYPNGMNGMEQSGQMGGYMNFNSQVNFQFHFDGMQTNGFNINNGSLKVKFWNNQNNGWTEISSTNFNSSKNTVGVSQNQVSNFYIITADKVTGIKHDKNNIPEGFSLKQNYPNPFNPSTTIDFSIKDNSFVNLSVYNILGQKVKTLIKRQMSAGSHSVSFNASDLSTGIYLYELNAGGYSKVMKMVLLK